MKIAIINKKDIPVTENHGLTKWTTIAKAMNTFTEGMEIQADNAKELKRLRLNVGASLRHSNKSADFKWATTIKDGKLYVWKGELPKTTSIEIKLKRGRKAKIKVVS